MQRYPKVTFYFEALRGYLVLRRKVDYYRISSSAELITASEAPRSAIEGQMCILWRRARPRDQPIARRAQARVEDRRAWRWLIIIKTNKGFSQSRGRISMGFVRDWPRQYLPTTPKLFWPLAGGDIIRGLSWHTCSRLKSTRFASQGDIMTL